MMTYIHDNKVEFCRCGRCVSAGVGKEAVVCRGLRDHFMLKCSPLYMNM
jgi:hypothetical protein